MCHNRCMDSIRGHWGRERGSSPLFFLRGMGDGIRLDRGRESHSRRRSYWLPDSNHGTGCAESREEDGSSMKHTVLLILIAALGNTHPLLAEPLGTGDRVG